jgi:hypothetical protein
MRRFGMLALAAGVWVGGATHAQDVDPQAHGAVAGGAAALGPPPPPPPAEPAGPDLPVAVGVGAGTATFIPGGGEPSGGSVPPGQGGGGGGGGGGGSGGGGATTNPAGTPILPAQTPSLSDSDPINPLPAEEQPSVGGPQVSVPDPDPFPLTPPPPPAPLPAPPPVPGEEPGPTEPPPPGTDNEPPGGPGPIVEGPEPGTLVLAGVGAAAALGWRRRRRR